MTAMHEECYATVDRLKINAEDIVPGASYLKGWGYLPADGFIITSAGLMNG